MAILFLLLYPLVFWLSWILLDHSLKWLFGSHYKKLYTIIGFALFMPVVVVLMGLLAVTVLRFPGG